MTDNRTTELREKLTERGVKHEVTFFETFTDTEWCVNDASCTYTELQNADSAYLTIQDITPEQAIAATLGRPKAKSHPYGYERDTGAYDCMRCECGCINDVSATYCNDCGGEIEIDESAEKEYYDGYSKHTVFAKKHDDGSLEFCERRYIPEDAATLGNGTCEMEYIDTYEYPDGEEDYLCKCSKCGRKSWEPAHNLPKFCGGCGRRVKR